MPYRRVQSRAGSPQLRTSLPFAITISSSSSSLASSTNASCAALVGSLLTASPSPPREPGSAGAAYEVQRSGNVREIVPQVATTSSRSGWPALSRTSQALASVARPRWRRERQTSNVVTRLSVSNSLSGGHWELDQVPAEGRGQQRAQDPSAVVEAQDDATRDAIDLRFRWGLDEHS